MIQETTNSTCRSWFAGTYRFTDYRWPGLPMVFISLIITALVVPLLFPF